MTASPDAARAAATPRMDIRPLTGGLGCEISGVDLARLDAATFAQVHAAFLEYSVVVVHDQKLGDRPAAQRVERLPHERGAGLAVAVPIRLGQDAKARG